MFPPQSVIDLQFAGFRYYFQQPLSGDISALSSFKPGPVASLLLITLLVAIAAILIAPDVDLPDTVLQGSSSPLAVHALAHHAQRDMNNSIDAVALIDQQDGFFDCGVVQCDHEALAIASPPNPILRC